MKDHAIEHSKLSISFSELCNYRVNGIVFAKRYALLCRAKQIANIRHDDLY